MIHVDLEKFASTGVFGPFDQTSRREQIVELLGQPDPDGYPGYTIYGHVGFELFGDDQSGCRIQIMFPHKGNMELTEAGSKPWACFTDWPDRRISWNLGRFIPDSSIDELQPTLDGFVELEMLFRTNGLRIFHNRVSNVELLFESVDQSRCPTLFCMVAHPKNCDG